MNQNSPTAMRATVDQPFSIILLDPAASGFEWRPRFAPDAIVLIRRKQVANRRSFVAASKVVFEFRPLARGHFDLSFDLKRSWEDAVAETRSFELAVD